MNRLRHHHHRPRLPAWQRRGLYITAAALLLSGFAWLLLHYWLGAGSGAEHLPHAGEAPLMRLHGAAGFAALFMLGALGAGHMPQGWRLSSSPVGQRRWAGQRRTGLVLCSLAAVLVLTAYALYYFAPESVRPALRWGHSAAGALMAGLAVFHARRR